jgi:hypothetical protein
MANNGIFYSSGNTLNFTTSGTTWLSLNSSGLLSGLNLSMSAVTTNTISATTYQNLPLDRATTGGTYNASAAQLRLFDNYNNAINIFGITQLTGGTYSNGTATFTNSTGGTFTVTGIASQFTGGTVTGGTNFTGGLTANTISATTYQGNVVTRFSDSIDSTGNTTAGAFTILKSMTIPANTYTTGDTVVFKFRVRKNATNGTMNYRISTNTTLSLTGSQTLGVFNAGATIVFGELSRVLSIKGATSEVFNTSITNVTNDSTTSTSAISSLSINWSVNQFIMFNINQASALDTTNISYYSITKI